LVGRLSCATALEDSVTFLNDQMSEKGVWRSVSPPMHLVIQPIFQRLGK
jgi:hypothetical protein